MPQAPHEPKAFTIKANGTIDRIITDLQVCEAFDPNKPPQPFPKTIAAKGLWDTGATRSVISQKLAADLGLKSSGLADVTHGGGQSKSPTYMVNFLLPHGAGVVGIQVTEFHGKDFDVVIGMDVITVGDLSITNVNGKTWVSFCTPPLEPIDYVKEIEASKYAGTPPRAPCPCGSGNKYKRCHGAA